MKYHRVEKTRRKKNRIKRRDKYFGNMERAKVKQEVSKRNSGEGKENIGCWDERERKKIKQTLTKINVKIS